MRTNPGIAILHRAWRAIPHAWRRRALDRAALWLAPGRERHPLEGEGWIVVGALSASTGLGEAARLAVQALVSLGRRVSVYDVSAAFRQDISVEPPALEPAEAGPGTVLMFVTPPLCALALWRIPRRILRGKRRIAPGFGNSRRLHPAGAPMRNCSTTSPPRAASPPPRLRARSDIRWASCPIRWRSTRCLLRCRERVHSLWDSWPT